MVYKLGDIAFQGCLEDVKLRRSLVDCFKTISKYSIIFV
jgi:hypothetical protein